MQRLKKIPWFTDFGLSVQLKRKKSKGNHVFLFNFQYFLCLTICSVNTTLMFITTKNCFDIKFFYKTLINIFIHSWFFLLLIHSCCRRVVFCIVMLRKSLGKHDILHENTLRWMGKHRKNTLIPEIIYLNTNNHDLNGYFLVVILYFSNEL